MTTSGRRLLRTGAAVLGMTALGAVGSGTASASTVTDAGGAMDRYGAADHTMASDSSGLPAERVDSTEHQSFEMPSMSYRGEHSGRHTDSNTDSTGKHSGTHKSDGTKSHTTNSGTYKSDGTKSHRRRHHHHGSSSRYGSSDGSGSSSGGFGGLF